MLFNNECSIDSVSYTFIHFDAIAPATLKIILAVLLRSAWSPFLINIRIDTDHCGAYSQPA